MNQLDYANALASKTSGLIYLDICYLTIADLKDMSKYIDFGILSNKFEHMVHSIYKLRIYYENEGFRVDITDSVRNHRIGSVAQMSFDDATGVIGYAICGDIHIDEIRG